MTTIAIKDFKHKLVYTNLIKKKILSYFWEFFYKPLFKIADIKKASNDISNIIADLRMGKIFYENGFFYAKNKFSNKVILELKKYGAKYDKYMRGYRIDIDLLPESVVKFLQKSNERAKTKLNALNNILTDLEYNLNHYVDLMIFDEDVEQIVKDAHGQIKRNIKHINVIEPELTQEQLSDIAKNYTKNIQLYIKKWANKDIINLRQKVQELVLQGYREDKITELLKKEYGIAQRKAKFLAQNETSIMLAEYKKVTYQEMGFTHFKWITILDARERPEHHKLNGKIFAFDNPPTVITEDGRTTKGLPGAIDYNCRCSLIPIKPNGII